MSGDDSSKSDVPPPDLPDFTDQGEVLRWAIKMQEQQRTARREKVRAAMKAADVPLPDEIVTELARLNPEGVRAILVDHPGFKAWERLGSYRISLSVFERSVYDLTKVVERLQSTANEDILSRARQHELEEMEDEIQKELFAATNAAHSLVDHSRRLQDVINIS